MTPTREELKAAGCLFSADKAGGAEMTAFKQTARFRQHKWAMDELGITEFGTHRGPSRGSEPPVEIANGTKLSDSDAEAGHNFLSDDIRAVVQARLSNRQTSETLDANRLRRDLLSSMPMAFNLFGEASSHDQSKRALIDLLAPGIDGPVDIVFEWSPERRSEQYTRDRTAFDVALLIGDSTGPRTAVGIETKYHEHSAREASPKIDGVSRYQAQTDFLIEIARRSGVFVDGWEEHVLTSDLRQIWRDHLLALSMRQHPVEWTEATRYVLIYPRLNLSYADATRRYSALLRPEDDSFRSFTIEDVVDAAFAHGGSTKSAFKRRYLW